MTASGMNPKRSSEPAPWGPWLTYMNSAKNTARRTATTVPITGRVYIVRAMWVRS